ncbi:MAG: META domain-containing protein [Acidimicrobiia bacterium]|nr:META domain-containing protein [Acidimicrobiia bacterium]
MLVAAVPVAFGLLLAAAACAGDDAGVATGPTDEPGEESTLAADLDGRTFLSIEVEGHDLVEGTEIMLSFEDGQLGASAGCNSMGGDATFDGDTLVVEGLFQTEMGCDPELHAQDEWLAGVLTGAPTLALDGDDLVVTTDDARIVLLDRSVAVPDEPLEGTLWRLDTIIDGDVASTPGLFEDPAPGEEGSDPDTPVDDAPRTGGAPTLQFAADGSVAVFAGCNQGSTGFEVIDDTLRFDPLPLTRMACEPGRMELERTVTDLLDDGEVTFEIDGPTLTLARGDAALVYRAVA